LEEFWALKDVSFEVKRGDRIGIIGRNGAGKSTLLKILSRITEPTEGRISIKGRVASLLEVGTGFHPELTGRENIYLNGAILGMSKVEIRRKFDEIVAFAEVERFLDTPVKRYSSGMYVRLAFAVAAHLEPEVLVVDEVLAVGDAQFQKKCLGKMEDVSREGRTVLFVSHNMASIRRLCTHGLFINAGQVDKLLSIDRCIDIYINNGELLPSTNSITPNNQAKKSPHFKLIKLSNSKISYGDSLILNLEIFSPFKARLGIEIEIHDEKGTPIIYTSTTPMMGKEIEVGENHLKKLELKIDSINLAVGRYFLYLWLIKPWAENYQIIRDPLVFDICFSDPFNSGFDFCQSYSRGAHTARISVTEEIGKINE
jgi:lipopolysaccharide transport system ATP-binding protein